MWSVIFIEHSIRISNKIYSNHLTIAVIKLNLKNPVNDILVLILFIFVSGASNVKAKVSKPPEQYPMAIEVTQDFKKSIDEARSKDEDIATAIIQVNEAVNTAFVHACSYIITKCYEVADYICDEEKNVIKAIEEGNVEEFKGFLVKVLDKSSKCQKDIMTLFHFIEIEKQRIIEEELKAKAKKELRNSLAEIENALKKVNEQLKLGIDNNLSDMKEKTDILDKDFIKRSIIKKMGTVKVQSEHLKEYCLPLKDVKDLEDFMKIYTAIKKIMKHLNLQEI